MSCRDVRLSRTDTSFGKDARTDGIDVLRQGVRRPKLVSKLIISCTVIWLLTTITGCTNDNDETVQTDESKDDIPPTSRVKRSASHPLPQASSEAHLKGSVAPLPHGVVVEVGTAVDPDATKETTMLFHNLQAMNHQVMFGHQDTTASGVGWTGTEDMFGSATKSDIHDLISDFPAVYGWNLGGSGGTGSHNLDGVAFDDMKKWIKEAYLRGGLNMLSMHLDNPVTQKSKSAWDTTPAVSKILPGGEQHSDFLKTLDGIADFLKELKTDDGTYIPVVLRPYHAHNQKWSWWSEAACSDKEYVALWEMTIKHFRDTQNIHHLLYVFSPQDAHTQNTYFFGYPGDEWVDVLGLGWYMLQPDGSWSWLGKMLSHIGDWAHKKQKACALTEVGFGSKVPSKDWWTGHLLKAIKYDANSQRMAWALVWRNHDEAHHFGPYPKSASADDFKDFHKDSFTVFNKDAAKFGLYLSGPGHPGTSVDPDATEETTILFHKLQGLNDRVMFGHQDTTAVGVGWAAEEGKMVGAESKSDIHELVADFPAVHGWDLGGSGGIGDHNLDGVPFADMKKWIKEAYTRGGLNTLSMHLDNPVTKKSKSAWDTTPAVSKILSGGEHHADYLKTLDGVATFLKELKTDDGTYIPVVLRPYHEHNQKWSWWSQAACSEKEYVALWEMTIKYFRDTQNIHHVLYVYSPQDAYTHSKYFERYPGDEWVDVLGLDWYMLKPDESWSWLGKTLSFIGEEAHKKKKACALTEVGFGSKVPSENWWTQSLLKAIKYSKDSQRMAWALVWRNHNEKAHFGPYPKSASADDFKEFHRDSFTVFAKDAMKLGLYV